MARKRRRAKSKQPRAKPIKLSPKYWLSGAKDIRTYRDSMLIEQDGRCAVSFLPLDINNSTLDHDHFTGRVRGCLQSEYNLLEGRYLKLYKKARLKEKYNVDFPEFLINLGEYLQRDYSHMPLHHELMTTQRKYIKRLTKAQITSKLLSDFKIKVVGDESHRDLVYMYMKAWVDMVETIEKKRRNNYEKEPS